MDVPYQIDWQTGLRSVPFGCHTIPWNPQIIIGGDLENHTSETHAEHLMVDFLILWDKLKVDSRHTLEEHIQ